MFTTSRNAKPMPCLMTTVFWDVMPWSLVSQCLRGIFFCLHYQGRSWGCRQKVSLKHPFESPCLQGIIFQMTVIFIIPAMTTSNLNFHPYLRFCYSLICSKFSFHNCLKKGWCPAPLPTATKGVHPTNHSNYISVYYLLTFSFSQSVHPSMNNSKRNVVKLCMLWHNQWIPHPSINYDRKRWEIKTFIMQPSVIYWSNATAGLDALLNFHYHKAYVIECLANCNVGWENEKTWMLL